MAIIRVYVPSNSCSGVYIFKDGQSRTAATWDSNGYYYLVVPSSGQYWFGVTMNSGWTPNETCWSGVYTQDGKQVGTWSGSRTWRDAYSMWGSYTNMPTTTGYIESYTLSATYTTQITVSYNGNGSTSGTVPSSHTGGVPQYASNNTLKKTYAQSTATVKFDYQYDSKYNTYTRTCYRTLNNSGWNTASDGSGTNYANGAAVYGTVTLYSKWNTSDYSDSWSGTVTAPNPTRDGYTFNGWYTYSGTYVCAGGSDYSSFTSDHTLYAHWEKDRTVTYLNTSGTIVQQYTVKYGSTITINTNTYSKESKIEETFTSHLKYSEARTDDKTSYKYHNYEANGWTGNDGNSYENQQSFTVTKDIVFTPAFKDTYTYSSITLPTLTSETLTFKGWEYGGYYFKGEVQPTKDNMTFVATWEPKCVVTYINGSDIVATYYLDKGSEHEVIKNSCTKPQELATTKTATFHFLDGTSTTSTMTRKKYKYFSANGWDYVLSSGSTVHYDAGAKVTVNSNMRFDASWTETEAWQDPEPKKTPAPTRKSYEFTGWYDSATGGTFICGGDVEYKFEEDIDLYAHWVPLPTTAVFVNNTSVEQKFYYTVLSLSTEQEEYITVAAGATKSVTKTSALTVINNVKIKYSDVYVTKTLNKTVSWEEESSPGSSKTYTVDEYFYYAISYSLTGGTGGPSQNPFIYIGTESTKKLNITFVNPTKDQCDFKGWSKNLNGSVDYTRGQEVTLSGSSRNTSTTLPLYAVWESKKTAHDIYYRIKLVLDNTSSYYIDYKDNSYATISADTASLPIALREDDVENFDYAIKNKNYMFVRWEVYDKDPLTQQAITVKKYSLDKPYSYIQENYESYITIVLQEKRKLKFKTKSLRSDYKLPTSTTKIYYNNVFHEQGEEVEIGENSSFSVISYPDSGVEEFKYFSYLYDSEMVIDKNYEISLVADADAFSTSGTNVIYGYYDTLMFNFYFSISGRHDGNCNPYIVFGTDETKYYTSDSKQSRANTISDSDLIKVFGASPTSNYTLKSVVIKDHNNNLLKTYNIDPKVTEKVITISGEDINDYYKGKGYKPLRIYVTYESELTYTVAVTSVGGVGTSGVVNTYCSIDENPYERSSLYYDFSSGLIGECTWYANGRTAEMRKNPSAGAPKGPTSPHSWGNANVWANPGGYGGNWEVTSAPSSGDAAVFIEGCHVGVVEMFDTDNIYLSEYNYKGNHLGYGLRSYNRNTMGEKFVFLTNTANPVIFDDPSSVVEPKQAESEEGERSTSAGNSYINLGGTSKWTIYNFSEGSSCTIVAEPNAGYSFKYWEHEGYHIEEPIHTFSVSEATDGVYTAVFYGEGSGTPEPGENSKWSTDIVYQLYEENTDSVAYWNYKKKAWLIGDPLNTQYKYIMLDSVSSTVSDCQYVNTLWRICRTAKIVVDCEISNTFDGLMIPIGNMNFCLKIKNGTAYTTSLAKNTSAAVNISTSRHIITMDFKTGTTTICNQNGDLESTIQNTPVDTIHENIQLFSAFGSKSDDYRDGDVYPSNFKLYSCKIYDYDYDGNDGILVRDFVPVKKVRNGQVGLWDKVFNRLYLSRNGDLIAGEELKNEDGSPKILEKTYRKFYTEGN